MRWVVIGLAVCVALGGSGKDPAAEMRLKAQAARAAEKPPVQPWGIWALDGGAMERVREGEVFIARDDRTIDFHDTPMGEGDQATLTIDDEHMFHLVATIGDEAIDLRGAIGLDDPFVEMFVARDDDQQTPTARIVLVGRIDGDRMALHLPAQRVWVALRREE